MTLQGRSNGFGVRLGALRDADAEFATTRKRSSCNTRESSRPYGSSVALALSHHHGWFLFLVLILIGFFISTFKLKAISAPNRKISHFGKLPLRSFDQRLDLHRRTCKATFFSAIWRLSVAHCSSVSVPSLFDFICCFWSSLERLFSFFVPSNSNFRVPNTTKSRPEQYSSHVEHCVIHVHGFHHSGTGVLRKTVFSALGNEHASIHSGTGKSQDEGQHLENVYPRFQERMKSGLCISGNMTLAQKCAISYRCPELLLSIAPDPAKRKRLHREWSSYWDMSKTFLIQKVANV